MLILPYDQRRHMAHADKTEVGAGFSFFLSVFLKINVKIYEAKTMGQIWVLGQLDQSSFHQYYSVQHCPET